MKERTVTASDGTRLAARSDGAPDAPALLCCNSLGTPLELWDPQLSTWARERHLLRFDQRGQGRSDAPAGAYTIERFGEDAVTVLDAFDVDRADLCGVSLGGVVALWLAIRRPERVRRVVLACTAARVGTREGWQERAAAVRAGGTQAVADLVMERFFSAGFRERDPGTVARFRAILAATSDEGYIGACLALADGDLRDVVPDAGAPALVIAGTDDQATPPSTVRALHDALPDARWLELEGAGHLANLEQPDRFAAAVSRFLTDE